MLTPLFLLQERCSIYRHTSRGYQSRNAARSYYGRSSTNDENDTWLPSRIKVPSKDVLSTCSSDKITAKSHTRGDVPLLHVPATFSFMCKHSMCHTKTKNGMIAV